MAFFGSGYAFHSSQGDIAGAAVIAFELLAIFVGELPSSPSQKVRIELSFDWHPYSPATPQDHPLVRSRSIHCLPPRYPQGCLLHR